MRSAIPGALLAAIVALSPSCAALHAASLPSGFEESIVLSGLTQPTAVRFAPDGRVFVAEKSGIVKSFDGLADPTPTIVADLRTAVHNFWDRGLLGLALHPDFPAEPSVYVLYTLDAAIGGTPPRWGVAGATADGCPDPIGAGCVVAGRLARLVLGADGRAGAEQVLLEDWCQQFPSHSIGDLAVGPDGALYVSGGDGASFTGIDYGQAGPAPVNPCGDPAGAAGVPTLPSAEGGALRSQDLPSPEDPLGYGGTILRLDPLTGAALPDNPLAGTPPLDDDRVVAFGLRNPYRMAFRPGTRELWIGDVGWNVWEEIDRLTDPTATVVNFGWPCYEGADRQPIYDAAGLTRCEALYAVPGAVTAPAFAYRHYAPLVEDDGCGTGESAVTGIAFYAGGRYPAAYAGALFFADFSRRCIWSMAVGSDGVPDAATRAPFVSGAAAPVALEVGPDGDLFYVDLNGGTVRRVRYTSTDTAPTAHVTAPTDATRWRVGAPIAFAGVGEDAEEGALPATALAWTLLLRRCAGACAAEIVASAAGVAAGSFTAPDPGAYPAELELRLTVTDAAGLADTASVILAPETVDCTFASAPPGLALSAGSSTAAAPFVRTSIVGSALVVGAPAPQSLDGVAYLFDAWSDGGARSHTVVTPAADATFTATFVTACRDDFDCDDLDPCSVDRCDLLMGCTHVPEPDGTPCDDDTVCNGVATCRLGACTPGPAPDCDDREPCTADRCDAVAGCLHAPDPDGTPCAPGSTCAGGAACETGTCAAVPPLCADFHVPGTQTGDVPPGSLLPSSACAACHGQYDAASDPFATWSGSLMAHAGRDPLFFAQLATANQDVPTVGYYCLRCHVPLAIVTGHADEPDGRLLDATDREGVSCHFCHSLVDPRFVPGASPPEDAPILAGLAALPAHYGNAMFVLDPSGTRRGPRADPLAPHAWIASPFHATSELCGTCHDVGNLAVTREPDGSYRYNAMGAPSPTADPWAQFPLERTYTEWKLSAFAAGGVDMGGRFGGAGGPVVATCQDCHMPRTAGKGCVTGAVRPDLARHELAGAAAPVLDLIAAATRDDPTVDQAALARGRAAAVSMLERAATLTLAQDGAVLAVRVTNETGHKLPTGHIEGRRVWLHVAFRDDAGTLLEERGRYDEATAELDAASTVVYEMHVGLSPDAAAATGLPPGPTGHMALADTIEKDNRIPPRGFTNRAFDEAGAPVVAWNYADGQFWDDVRFLVPPGATRAEATLHYQSTPRHYVEALRDGNVSDHWGETLHALWVATGRGAPIAMTTATLALVPPSCRTAADCDDGDPCTLDACDAAAQCASRLAVPLGSGTTLALGRLHVPGRTTLALRAVGALAPSTAAGLDPVATGLRIELRDASGNLLERLVLPGGARDAATGAGWTRHRSGRTWRYRDPAGAHGGIRSASVGRHRDDGGRIRVLVRGRDRARPPLVVGGGLELRLALGADPDACAGHRFADPASPTRPRCRWSAGGTRVLCR